MYLEYLSQIKSVYVCVSNSFTSKEEAELFFIKTLPIDNDGLYGCKKAIDEENLPALVLFKVRLQNEDAYYAAGICTEVKQDQVGGNKDMYFDPNTITVFFQKQTPDMLPATLNISRAYGPLTKLDMAGLDDLCVHLDTNVTLCQAVNKRPIAQLQKKVILCDPSNILSIQPYEIICKRSSQLESMKNNINNKIDEILIFADNEFNLAPSPNFIKPKIKFSKEHRTIEYGKYDVKMLIKEAQILLEKIKKRIASTGGHNKEILERLKKVLENLIKTYEHNEENNEENIEEYRDKFNHIDNELLDLLSECDINPETSKTIEEVNELNKKFINSIYKVDMLGCYYSDKNEIILYTCTICNCCTKNRIDFDEEIISVLAHELFHAIHYFAISDFQISPSTKFWGSKNNKYKTVIESLARYFEYTWCIKNKYNDIKNGLIREANTTRFPGWPYAGAKIFMHCDNYAFEDIFHISVRFGWSDAYDELIDIGRHKGIYS